jgi:hypothetical protein
MTATLKMNHRILKNKRVVNFLSNIQYTSITRDRFFALKLPPFVDAQVIKCIAQGKVTRKEKKIKDDKHNY